MTRNPIEAPPITFNIFDGDLLLGEVQPGYPMPPPAPSGPQVKAAYTWGAMGLVSERLVQQSVSLWYAFGPQGETRQLTNNTGAVSDTYVYTAYGAPVASTGADPNPFRYGGQFGYYTDPGSSGMMLCGARWYDPYVGRWLSRDPIDYEGGANLYEYCGGDPVGLVDPLGLDAAGRKARARSICDSVEEWEARWTRNGTALRGRCPAHKGGHPQYTDCGRFVHAVVGPDDPTFPSVGTPSVMHHIAGKGTQWVHGLVSAGGAKPGDVLWRKGHVALLMKVSRMVEVVRLRSGGTRTVRRTIYETSEASFGQHEPQIIKRRKLNFKLWARPSEDNNCAAGPAPTGPKE